MSRDARMMGSREPGSISETASEFVAHEWQPWPPVRRRGIGGDRRVRSDSCVRRDRME